MSNYQKYIPSGEAVGCLYWIIIGIISLMGMGLL